MIPLNGFTCCLGAAAFYLLSRITGRDAEILKSVIRVCHLKDLVELVEEESKVLVAISGRVGSETPIKSDLSGISCVLVEETVQQHFLKLSWRFSWVQGSTLMQPLSREVPWYLDDGTARVNVAGAKGATGFSLMVENEVFEKSEPSSFVRGTLDYLRGLKMLGVKRMERVLPTGTRLTVVGEAVKDGIGDVKIQRPEEGPFYVSLVPFDKIISKLGKWSRRFEYAAIGLTVLGVILISKPVIDHILGTTEDNQERMRHIRESRRQQRLRQQRLNEAAAERANQVTRETIEDNQERMEHIRESRRQQRLRQQRLNEAPVERESRRQQQLRQQRLNEAAAERANQVTRESERQHNNSSDSTRRDDEVADLCVICFEQKYDAAFTPCGHLCCCMTCSLKLQENICPFCREPFSQILKIYRH